MISRTFAMRYACRQRGCGYIPKSEADWIIAEQKDCTSKKEYWFCAACGGEFKYGLGSGGLDSRGQDKPYQHVIFMQIPWGDGKTRTMCARAVEPTQAQKACILALKGITAAAGLSVPPGAKAGLIALVIETNKCFDKMVGDTLPRKTLTVKRPMHVSLGELEVKGNGILSLSHKDLGTEKPSTT